MSDNRVGIDSPENPCADCWEKDKQIKELLDAIKAWDEFWKDMPKGQMGKLCFDVGLLNDAFLKTNRVLAKYKESKAQKESEG